MPSLINPFIEFRVSQPWLGGPPTWSHKKDHAIDYAMADGTVFASPADGQYRHGLSTSGGIGGDLLLPDGSYIAFRHLSRQIAPQGAVKQGQPLAASGHTGAAKGPHMHTFGIKGGDRWNWTLDAAAPASGGESKPLPIPSTPDTEDDDDMTQQFSIIHKGNLYLAAGFVNGGIEHLSPGALDVLSGGASAGNPGYWLLSNGKTLDYGIPQFDTKGNQACFDQLMAIYG